MESIPPKPPRHPPNPRSSSQAPILLTSRPKLTQSANPTDSTLLGRVGSEPQRAAGEGRLAPLFNPPTQQTPPSPGGSAASPSELPGRAGKPPFPIHQPNRLHPPREGREQAPASCRGGSVSGWPQHAFDPFTERALPAGSLRSPATLPRRVESIPPKPPRHPPNPRSSSQAVQNSPNHQLHSLTQSRDPQTTPCNPYAPVSPTHPHTHTPTHPHTHTPTHPTPNTQTPTHPLTPTPTHPNTHSPQHPLTPTPNTQHPTPTHPLTPTPKSSPTHPPKQVTPNYTRTLRSHPLLSPPHKLHLITHPPSQKPAERTANDNPNDENLRFKKFGNRFNDFSFSYGSTEKSESSRLRTFTARDG